MWTLNPSERLREWQNFRIEIGQLPIAQACSNTTHLWSYAPYVTHYLDPNRANSLVTWPDPWTLLQENYYCDLAKSVGMLYTLYLSTHQPTDIQLCIYNDRANTDIYNVVQLDQGKYVLNFEFDTVVSKDQLPTTLDLKYQYTASDLGLTLY